VIDHVDPPLVGPTSARKIGGGTCSMLGAAMHGTGIYARHTAKRLRALTFFTDICDAVFPTHTRATSTTHTNRHGAHACRACRRSTPDSDGTA
jgi:hypothetical protein